MRGEISRPTRAGSGHVYLTLKDENAVLDGIVRRGAATRLAIQPEEGMEVVCTGKLTTYPGRSKYQMVIEQMELAGEGALLKLLEDRRRKLAAEGVFDEDRKRDLPFLPMVIGVVTSPTGAVIRDILHRLTDRFPVHVLVWPVLVQGDGAKDQIAAAIEGFNLMSADGALPRPELLIVARGGGSLEDLWAFNEEAVVRAAAESEIPLISAVGHETDTTLIDLASDLRAPTPTAAAEIAVPVRAELVARLMEDEGRLFNAVRRIGGEAATRLTGLARGLGDPRLLIESKAQTLDHRWDAAGAAAQRVLYDFSGRLQKASEDLRTPHQQLAEKAGALAVAARGLGNGLRTRLRDADARTRQAIGRLRPEPVLDRTARGESDVARASARLGPSVDRRLDAASERLSTLGKMLDANSYERSLERGFVLVRDRDGVPVTSASGVASGAAVTLAFHDGERGAVIDGEVIPPSTPRPRKPRSKSSKGGASGDSSQGSLL